MLDKILGGVAVAAAALLLPAAVGAVGRPARQGSGNVMGAEDRMVGQVLSLLSAAGIPAQRAMDGGPQISLGTADESVANGAHAVAERVLLSTGFRPKVVKVGGEYRVAVKPGPPAPASADRALRV